MTCGIDESGRGSLIGPVCAACVILPTDFPIHILNDSKKLTPKKREEVFAEVLMRAQWGIGWSTAKEVDTLNVLQATFLAMRRAYHFLRHQPITLALVDGNQDPHLGIHTQTIVKGDTKEPSIMAASILAKCARDRYMEKIEFFYPGYYIGQHKGYATALHRQKIQENGLISEHRKTFCKRSMIDFS